MEQFQIEFSRKFYFDPFYLLKEGRHVEGRRGGGGGGDNMYLEKAA